MLKVNKHIDIKGKDGRIISKAIDDIINEFDKRADIKGLKKLDVYVTKNPVKVCKQILFPGGKIKVKRHGEMREWVCGTRPNFSYWEKGQAPKIMLNATEKIFTSGNFIAIEGLFAHELMHLLNKHDGIEDILEKEISIANKHLIEILNRHKPVKPYTLERLYVSLIRVTTTATLVVKDVLANTRTMSFGFDNQLYENYKVVLSDAKKIRYTDSSILKSLKKDQKHVLDDAFLVYLGLNMSWTTFKMFQNKRWKELQELTKIQVPKTIKKNAEPILESLMQLRSSKDRKTIRKILISTLDNYYKVVKYYSSKLR